MNSVKNKAQEYIVSGLSVIPLVGENNKDLDIKKPAVYSWGALQKTPLTTEEAELLFNQKTIRPDLVEEKTDRDGKKYTEKGLRTFTDPQGLGIITGSGSGSLEVIDVDTKHDTTGTLWDSFKTLLEDNLEDLYPELVIARTRSGGYHIYYRCREIGRNIKLSVKENREVLIETRGEGGYVVAPPTAGYEFIQGSPGTIPEITPQKREVILTIARSFNEVEEEKPRPRTSTVSPGPLHTQGLTPWEDYDNRGDIIALMESHGWRVVSKKGENINLLRPGKTDSKTSGSFHTRLRTLYIFSTSTIFENKGYTPSAVFSLLECGGDYKLSARRLRELGYGDKLEKYKTAPTMVKTEVITVSTGTKANQGTTVISTPGATIKIEDLRGDEVVITSPGPEATAEVLRTLEMIAQTRKRTYIKEGDNPIIREYEYKLQALLDIYDKKLEEAGDLSTQETDSLLDEVVKLGAGLDPLDRDQYRALVMAIPWVKDRGITQESYQVAVEKLTTTRAKEEQARALRDLITEAKKHQENGDTGKAIALMDQSLGIIRIQDKETEFNNLLVPVTEEGVKERLSKKPDNIFTGYKIGGEDLSIPSGALSVFSAPTSHGKTTFLINLALNIARQGKEIYLFSFEEDGDTMLTYVLNSYMGIDLSKDNRGSLRSYFSTGSTEYIKRDAVGLFSNYKNRFFKEMVETRKINVIYTSYDSQTLIDAIRYLHKNANPGAILIDYIQLLNLPASVKTERKINARQEELKEICISLKDLAVDTGLPIILGAQFNREVVNPLLLHSTKIGEAGDIERVANLIVGFWNTNFEPLGKLKGEDLEEIERRGINSPDTLYVKILKNRGGLVGLQDTIKWNGNTQVIGEHLPPGSSVITDPTHSRDIGPPKELF